MPSPGKSDQENKEPHKSSKVRFSLWGSGDQSSEPSGKTTTTSGQDNLSAVEMVTYTRSTSLCAETEAIASQS